MGWFAVVAPSSQAPPLGRVNHICSTSSQAPPLGRVNHISLSPVISPTVIHQQKYTKALCHSGVSVLALQAAAFTGFSWSQLHLPSAFSLIRVQSQRSFSFSISLPPFPLLFLLYLFFSFLCPSLMWLSCKG